MVRSNVTIPTIIRMLLITLIGSISSAQPSLEMYESKNIQNKTRTLIRGLKIMKFIKPFEETGINDIDLVGGKNASLGEMIKNLSSQGVRIPSGFVITAEAYKHFIAENKLEAEIKKLLSQIDKNDLQKFAQIGKSIRTLINQAPVPNDLADEIRKAYALTEQRYGENCDVAVRSSATAEDLPNASFAGQQETYLNIQGAEALLKKVPDAFASLFTDRAISYRMDQDFDHMSVALSIGVQKMIRSDQASSGVIFTLDTESGFRDVVYITSAYGLGENVVQGVVNPDEFYIHKPLLEKGFKPLLKKRVGSKQVKMIYADSTEAEPVRNIDVEQDKQYQYSITDDEALELAKQAVIIEKHYSKHHGRWCPMDIEWAKDGIDGKLYIVQARPETIHGQKEDHQYIEEYILNRSQAQQAKILERGKSVGRKIVTGKARVIESSKQMHEVQAGEIIVTDMTDPDWEPIMKKAGGIITNRGGRTCHAAIVSRELGIPAIVGTTTGTENIPDGSTVTLDCSTGEVGMIYEGDLSFELKRIELVGLRRPRVDIMMNIANPDEAFNLSQLPASGVGLTRLEFIINNAIQIHPMALVHPELVKHQEDREAIERLTADYKDKKQYFIDKLAQEAGTIAAAFYPRPVIIRMSDFKSNEYRDLIAGRSFEPQEENPMIGFRGASRYDHDRYREGFALECAAMKKIRNEMGLTNVILMLPFVRTVPEAQSVVKKMADFGLKQGENGLQLYMMCEIPSNVILIDQFSKIFDGFSIGSNDLTQMTLAIDRDSDLVADIFDERDPAVSKMLELAIQGAKRNGKKIGICGQAPSDYPEVAEFLVQQGIDSISLTPDSVLKEIMMLQ